MVDLEPLAPISDKAFKALDQIIPILKEVPEGNRKFVLRQAEEAVKEGFETSTSQISRKFLLALFTDLANDKNFKRRFKAAHKDLHCFFWEIKQNQSSKYFVKDFLFDTNGNFPHSEEIDELLQEFRLSGILSRTDKYYDITITNSSFADEFKSNLTDRQRSLYEEILKKFKEQFGVPDK